jgi:hypothetical protein
MPQARLTETLVKTAKAEPGAERTIYWDQSLPGFGLMVTSADHRSFVVQYRAAGDSKRMTLNGKLALKDARKEARAYLGSVAKGRDPLAERRKQAAEATNTLRSIAEEYLRRESGRLRTINERRACFERLVYPKLGARQIDTIKRSNQRPADRIEDENGPRWRINLASAAVAELARQPLRRISVADCARHGTDQQQGSGAGADSGRCRTEGHLARGRGRYRAVRHPPAIPAAHRRAPL